MLKKKIWSKFQKIIELFTQKIVTKLSKIWVWDPGTGIRDPGSGKNLFRIQGEKGTGSRIRKASLPWPRQHLGPKCARLLSLGHRWCSVGLLIWLLSAVLSLKVLTSCIQTQLAVYCTLYSRGLQFRTFLEHCKQRFIDSGPQKKLFLLLGCLKIFLFLHIPV